MELARDLALVLIAAVAGGAAAQWLRLPLIVGYFLAGVVVSPATPGPTVTSVHNLELLAEIGVALLLFAVGLEFPPERLAPVRRVALIGTPVQIVLTILLGYGLGRLLGWPAREALWFGAMLSFSSTAAVLKVFMTKGVLETLAARVTIGLLLVQDLAVIVLMPLLPAVTGLEGGLGSLAAAILRAAALIAGVVLLGQRVFPRIIHRIALWNARELFLLGVVAAGLGVGYAAHLAGLSMAIGAFAAGVVLSGSAYSHQALAEVRPLRDVFAMVFFVSLGMLIDPAVVGNQAGILAALLLAVLVGKGLIFAGVTRAFGYGNIVPFVTGLGLWQLGEFSFVLAREGLAAGAISPPVYNITLALAVASIALTPATESLAAPIYHFWRQRVGAEPLANRNLPEKGVSDHVIIGGFGRTGHFLANVLRRLGQSFVVVELDAQRADQAAREGLAVVYGDVASPPVLKAAGVARARMVVLTLPDPATTLLAARAVRSLNPEARIIARAAGEEQLRDLARLGVYQAIQPQLEAELEIAREVLSSAGLADRDIHRFLDRVRRERYAPLIAEVLGDELLEPLRRVAADIEADWVHVGEKSPLAGRSIRELGIRQRTGASVVAMGRGDGILTNPPPDTVFQPGDTVLVVGTSGQIRAFRELALHGGAGGGDGGRERPGMHHGDDGSPRGAGSDGAGAMGDRPTGPGMRS